MKPIDYYTSLTTEERNQYAKRAGCSIHHFQLNLFRVKGGAKKTPKPELLINLSIASEGNVSLDEAIDYFHSQPIKALAKEMQGGLDPEIKLVKGRAENKQLEMNVLNEPKKVGL